MGLLGHLLGAFLGHLGEFGVRERTLEHIPSTSEARISPPSLLEPKSGPEAFQTAPQIDAKRPKKAFERKISKPSKLTTF